MIVSPCFEVKTFSPSIIYTYILYIRYPIVARAWPSGCIGRVRVRARAKVSSILHTNIYFDCSTN